MHHDYSELEMIIDDLESKILEKDIVIADLKEQINDLYKEKAEAAESYVKSLNGRDMTASNQADYIAKLQTEKRVQEDTIRGYQTRLRLINKAFADAGYARQWEMNDG